jgi:HK97 family phage major capsid protein
VFRKADWDFLAVIEALVRTKGGRANDPAAFAEANGFPERAVTFLKAAVAAGSIADATWAGPLAGFTDLANDWFSTLRNFSLLDALLDQGAKRVPANVRFLLTTLSAAAHTISEALWYPLSRMELAGDRQGYMTALSAVVLSNEFMRFSSQGAQQLINTELAGSVAGATNGSCVTLLLDSLTLSSSSGDARADLQTLFAAVSLSSRSKPILVASPEVTKQLALLGTTDGAPAFPDLSIPQGGSISGVPLISVDELHAHGAAGADGDVLMLVDAAQIAADAGVIEVDVSDEATIAMVDPAGTGAQSIVSMYQTNAVCIRTRRIFSLQRVRDSAVAGIKLASYGQGSP